MRRWLLLLLPLLLIFDHSFAFARKGDIELRISAAVEVGADGRVSSVKVLGDELPDALHDPLVAEIRRWEFEPARVEDRPAASATHVHVTLRASEVPGSDDAWAVHITSASAAPGKAHAPAPSYPMAAVRARIAAEVILAVDMQADGSVGDVREHSVRTSGGGKRTAEMFVRHASKTIREWRFIPEAVEGRPVATTVLVPIRFCIGESGCRVPYKKGDPTPITELVSEQPVVRLKTEAAGRTL